jgi:hypothetical protein
MSLARQSFDEGRTACYILAGYYCYHEFQENTMRKRSTILAITLALMVYSASAAPIGGEGAFFNRKDLDGWEGLTEYWSVKDGSLVGSTPKGLKFNTFLCSKQIYKDFELRFDVRLKDGAGNSGVQIRSKIKEAKTFTVAGPQCDMADGYWGCLYGELFSPDGKGGMMKDAPKAVVANAVTRKGSFVEYSIKCVGKHVTIKLNGLTTVDADFPEMPDEGIIAWQLHTGGPMEVTFRNILFKNLSK